MQEKNKKLIKHSITYKDDTARKIGYFKRMLNTGSVSQVVRYCIAETYKNVKR